MERTGRRIVISKREREGEGRMERDGERKREGIKKRERMGYRRKGWNVERGRDSM